MKPIGGYFELELRKGKEYHIGARALNAGRNAIEYVLKGRKYNKGLVPAYSCDSILEPFKKLGIPFEFYNINRNMMPEINLAKVESSVCILVINFFGLLERQIAELVKNHSNIIIDNSQAFFARPLPGNDTVYSPRKFFGVSDGGYLYSDLQEDFDIDQDHSYDRFEHLLKRIDLSPEEGYGPYRRTQRSLSSQPIRKMSRLTQSILASIDYDRAKTARENNFRFLHEKLGSINRLTPIIEASEPNGPMIYPFLVEYDSLRDKLIQNRVFVAKYWEEVNERVAVGSIEWDMANKMVPLPVDQRYSIEDMKVITKIIFRFC